MQPSGASVYSPRFRPIPECRMSVKMPDLDQDVLARRAQIVAALRAIVPGEGVIDSEREMRPFESDGLTAYRQLPMVVVLPSTTEQVSQVLRYCHENKIKVVPRGAGTSLSGGALPLGRRRSPRHGEILAHPRDRLRQSRRGGRARRHQSRGLARRSRTRASITRPIRPRRSPAPSAAMSRRIPAACIA